MTAEEAIERFLDNITARELRHVSGAELLAALDAAGFVVVPKVATEAMITALNSYALCAGYVDEGYVAMLAARPR